MKNPQRSKEGQKVKGKELEIRKNKKVRKMSKGQTDKKKTVKWSKNFLCKND